MTNKEISSMTMEELVHEGRRIEWEIKGVPSSVAKTPFGEIFAKLFLDKKYVLKPISEEKMERFEKIKAAYRKLYKNPKLAIRKGSRPIW